MTELNGTQPNSTAETYPNSTELDIPQLNGTHHNRQTVTEPTVHNEAQHNSTQLNRPN